MRLPQAANLSEKELLSELQESPIQKAFEKSFGRSSLRSHIFVTLVKFAYVDREITQLERKFIIRKVGRLIGDDNKEELGEQFDLVASMVRRNIKSKPFIPIHMAYLIKKIEKHRNKFSEILAGVIAADGKFEKTEEVLLDDFVGYLNLDNRTLEEIKVNCRFSLERFRKEENISEDESKKDYDLPEIKLEF